MIDQHRTGLVFGILLGSVHLLWSILIAAGWAEPLMQWTMSLHRVESASMVLPFSLTHALTLLAVTLIVGYVIGYIFALIWNGIQRA